MSFIKSKVNTIKNKLNSLKVIESKTLDYEYIECPCYKKDNIPPSLSENWKKASENYTFDGVDTHYWIHIKIPAIEKRAGQEPRLCVRTGREGTWDARNPQFIVYVNGKTEQAFDVNHTWMPLEYDTDYDIYLYLYSGLVGGTYLSVLSLAFIDLETEGLFYDKYEAGSRKVPWDRRQTEAPSCRASCRYRADPVHPGSGSQGPQQSATVPAGPASAH